MNDKARNAVNDLIAASAGCLADNIRREGRIEAEEMSALAQLLEANRNEETPVCTTNVIGFHGSPAPDEESE